MAALAVLVLLMVIIDSYTDWYLSSASFKISSFLLWAIAQFGVFTGWWMLAAPAPHQVINARASSRKLVRYCVIGTAATTCWLFFGIAVALGGGWSLQTERFLIVTAAIAMPLSLVLYIVCYFAQLRYIQRWLAPRMQSPRNQQVSRVLMWLGPALICGPIVLAIGVSFISVNAADWLMTSGFMIGSGFAVLLYFILMVCLSRRLRDIRRTMKVHRQIEAARADRDSAEQQCTD